METMPENDYKDEVLYRLCLVRENLENEMAKHIQELLYDIVEHYENEFTIDTALNPYPFWLFGEDGDACVWVDAATKDLVVTSGGNQWAANDFGYVGLDMLYRTILATINKRENN